MFYLLWGMVWKLEQFFAHWSILGLIIVTQLYTQWALIYYRVKIQHHLWHILDKTFSLNLTSLLDLTFNQCWIQENKNTLKDMRNQSDKFRRWDSQQEKLISFFIKLNHKIMWYCFYQRGFSDIIVKFNV